MEIVPEQPNFSSIPANASLPPGNKRTDPIDYPSMFLHLFSIGQMLCGQTHGVADRLSKEVFVATQEQAQLVLRHQQVVDTKTISATNVAVSFPVQFRNRVYGTLSVVPDKAEPTRPALPLSIAHLLVQVCSWLFYTLEVSAFFQGRPQEYASRAGHSLTKRERDVLALICRGLDQKAIASKLSISPATVKKHRQHIYEQLGVRNEHDALLAAYRAGLYTPLEDLFDHSSTPLW